MKDWDLLDVATTLFFVPILIFMWVGLIIYLLSLFGVGPCAEGC